MQIHPTIHHMQFRLLFIAMGFTAMIAQVVLLRELVVFFSGNEMTVGIILTFWLLGTALGSGPLSRLFSPVRQPATLFMSSLILIVVLLPASLSFIRLAKQIFVIPLGEMVPPYAIFLVPLIALTPICVIMGLLFPLGCQLLTQTKVDTVASIPGYVYLYEAIGSGIAGFVTSIFLFRFFENAQIAALVCLVYVVAAVSLAWMIYPRYRPWTIGSAVLIALFILMFAPKFDQALHRRAWLPLQLLRSKTTIYGNIVVTQLGEAISFYENGVIMFTHPDPMAAEEAVHFALLQHPQPRRVLLIGGDAAGILPQVIHHPSIQRTDLVLLDPTAIQLAKQYIRSLPAVLKDERLNIWHMDGRLFLKKSNQRFDVVIINLPEPSTALINRFYTQEFFELAQRHLSEHGILSFSIPSSENVLSEEQTVLLSCLYQTMLRSFPDIVLIPGSQVHFIGCIAPNVLTRDSNQLVQRLTQRQLPTQYVREYYVPFRMTPARMRYIIDKVAHYPTQIVNRDFQPIGYFYSIMLWLTAFKIDLALVLKVLTRWRMWLIAMILAAMVIGLLRNSARAKKRADPQPVMLMAIFMIGLFAISLEIVIILGFQAIYGYAYYQVALIMSGFMIGLMLGSWISLRNIAAGRFGISDFIFFQIIGVAFPLIIWITFLGLARITLPSVAVQAVFLVLIAGVGIIAGYQFPLANRLLFHPEQRIERVGGTLYAADLFGSVAGVLITSIVLVPILGLGYTALLFSLLNLCVTLALIKIRNLAP